ncbi:MAG TPA: hypothetical protein VNU71_17930 [Burkholderiaceae bacterium]|nr:hypothetical protein [Burkholderiaceae bacterium]
MALIWMRTRRRWPPVVAVGVALGASLAALCLRALPGEQPPAGRIVSAVTQGGMSEGAIAPVMIAAPASVLAPAAAPRIAAPQPTPALATRPAAVPMPYKFVGHLVIEGEPALVFFGRGRTVTLRGPGPLDDEFAVDAILEHQVVLRHVPTSSSQFAELAPRKPDPAAAASPDAYPQD